MPKFLDDPNAESFTLGGAGNFHYSGTRPEKLTASDYTLATILVDTTTSTGPFTDLLLNATKNSVKACAKSPRADNLLLRLAEFNSSAGVAEIHGFRPLQDIDPDQYDAFRCKGTTNLCDASYSSVQALLHYAKTLTDQDFTVNGVVILITDGDDNASTMTAKQTRDLIAQAHQDESLESLTFVVIGINTSQLGGRLKSYCDDIAVTYQDVGDATPGKIAKIAQFVSKSISSASQALGTGNAPPSLAF